MEQQNSKKLGLINSLVLLVVTIAALFLALKAGSTVGLAGVVLLNLHKTELFNLSVFPVLMDIIATSLGTDSRKMVMELSSSSQEEEELRW